MQLLPHWPFLPICLYLKTLQAEFLPSAQLLRLKTHESFLIPLSPYALPQPTHQPVLLAQPLKCSPILPSSLLPNSLLSALPPSVPVAQTTLLPHLKQTMWLKQCTRSSKYPLNSPLSLSLLPGMIAVNISNMVSNESVLAQFHTV